MRIILILANALLINLGFILAFFVKYGLPFPEYNFIPYKKSFVFLTLIYISALAVFGVYKNRFKSSWVLFQRVFLGIFMGTLLSVAFVYVFRARWGAFPTSVFAISFFINLPLIFKVNQIVLKTKKKIKKQVIILGEGEVDDIVTKKANVQRKPLSQVRQLAERSGIDEIVISEKITDSDDLSFLLYLEQKLKAEILFSPNIYFDLMKERLNGNGKTPFLNTFIGRQSDIQESFIRLLDIVGSIGMLVVISPILLIVTVLIKATSPGPVFYKQKRVGQDGKVFTLIKFRTMIHDAEKKLGPILAEQEDPRVTKIGRILRCTRIDEFPQLINVIKGEMSLVGPRPERPYFVKLHKALQGVRLAVKPGLTGIAQVYNYYDLHPKHKIKYDYIYIQQRSLRLNLFILLRTIPVIFSKKGW
jgi:lipopolysaccharide/colanic/teichoic acid biosynthesis glycosyltransferase